ncbi:MAG: aspartate aminotransferase [Gemmatimonadetes bacterium]|nr:aspartate aminotransferase [Gemmatimonadota bacterium]
MQISAKAAQLKREGVDVIALSAGEPDFDTPPNIKNAAIRAIEDGFTKYTTPSSGIIELKEAICRKFLDDNNLQYAIDQITVNNGAKHSLFLAVAALINTGDEVIIPTPYWVTYSEQPRLVGGEPIIVKTRPENGLKITAEEFQAAITSKTRMLFLCSPSNPSGAVYTKAELEDIAQVAVENNVYVLSDEIYEKLLYDDVEHCSIASFGEEIKKLTIVVNGVSKAYAMTGWRIGYAGADAEVIHGMNKVQMQEVSHPSSISQKAAVEALNGPQESVEEMRKAFDTRRCYMVDRLNMIEGIECLMPKGAFYAYPVVSKFYGKKTGVSKICDSVDLCKYLLEEGRVACVPGVGFGTEEHIRLSYATSMNVIEDAMDRIENALKKLMVE